jgi:hypothetical protein
VSSVQKKFNSQCFWGQQIYNGSLRKSYSLIMSRRLFPSIIRPSSFHFTALNPSRDLPTRVVLQRRAPQSSIRNASTAIPPKTIVLEKPDKFRPPSHPQRLNRKLPRQYPGPPLSESERQAQKTRRYPHMFPNEGTPLHRFLTNKWIHMWISLVCFAHTPEAFAWLRHQSPLSTELEGICLTGFIGIC